MSEKEKRKEKSKRRAGHSNFAVVALFLVLLILAGVEMLIYVLLQPSFDDVPINWATSTSIRATNQWAFTQISASETAVVEHATATAEAEQGRGVRRKNAKRSRSGIVAGLLA